MLALVASGAWAFQPPSLPSLSKRNVVVRAASEEESAELGLYGGLGTAAAFTVFWSEWTLRSTGCGLPAGPFGLLGAAEGVSYLAIIGIIGASLATKFKTGSGLPPGPLGLLGAAEGLSYLAALVGIVVLVLQIQQYGYIPNAVPIDGGVCS